MRIAPNQPATGKAGIARLLAVEHVCPGLPEPERSPMNRFLITLLFLAMTCAGHGAMFSLTKDGMAGISDADIRGTWIIEPATYPFPPLPKDLVSFALELKRDGTFSSTNTPAGIFHVSSSDCSGTWHLRPSKGVPQLTLTFTNPPDYIWSSSIIWLDDGASTPPKLGLQASMGQGAYALVCLTKKGDREGGAKGSVEGPIERGEPGAAPNAAEPLR